MKNSPSNRSMKNSPSNRSNASSEFDETKSQKSDQKKLTQEPTFG